VLDRGPAAPVSAVVPVLDGSAGLGACLAALLGGTRLPAEVLVVDQADARVVQTVLDRHAGSGVPLRHLVQAQRGRSAALQLARREARTTVVAVVPAGVVPARDWVEQLADAPGGQTVVQALGARASAVAERGVQVGRRAGNAAAHPRRTASRAAGRLPVPPSGLLDLPLLRQALQGAQGSVLVVGDRRVVVRALPGGRATVDAAGTDPHDAGVTVVSTADAADSLPPGQWDVVVVTEPGPDPAGRLAAAAGACRRGGLLVARAGPSRPAPDGTTREAVGAGARRRWLVARRV
jgi:hypothetical protein